MNTEESRPARTTEETGPTDRPESGRGARFWSILSAVLFVPAALATGALTLASEQAARCLMAGDQCGSPLPWWMFTLSAGVALLACFITLGASAARVRQVALTTQLMAECMALTVILSRA